MSALLIRGARVLSMGASPGQRRGAAAMNDLGILPRADVLVQGDRIAAVEPQGLARSAVPAGAQVIEAAGRVLMPGFVDAHTHALWAGDRLDEWEMRRRGASSLDILKAGGGIMSTVRAVRAADETTLSGLLRERLRAMLREGTTTVEIKSGYGLTTDHELKMLRVIAATSGDDLPTVVPTALLGHALDPEDPRFVETTISRTLAAVHGAFPRIAIDAFCEEGAWSKEQCVRLFEAARALGHPFRVHADQFHDLGMTAWAMDHGAVSVDHLEATPPDVLALLAKSKSFGVMLPATGFHLFDPRAAAGGAAPAFAEGRRFVDQGGALVIATNCNPGSAPTHSMPMTIALAVRFLGLSPAEAIMASTVNPAALLGFTDRGRIAPGLRADLVLLLHRDERMLAYEFGGCAVDSIVLGGRLIGAV